MVRDSKYTKTPIILTLFLLPLFAVDACYFSDCPTSYSWDGKRETENQIASPVRKCPPCGVRGTGQCFSSTMCCTPALGCVVGENEVTERCRSESRIPLECASAGPTCFRPGRGKEVSGVQGVCAADGLCCNAEGCSYHHECFLSAKDPSTLIPTSDEVFQSLLSAMMTNLRRKPNFGHYVDRSIMEAIKEYRRSQQNNKLSNRIHIVDSGMY